jgi:hypothetical protein
MVGARCADIRMAVKEAGVKMNQVNKPLLMSEI